MISIHIRQVNNYSLRELLKPTLTIPHFLNDLVARGMKT